MKRISLALAILVLLSVPISAFAQSFGAVLTPTQENPPTNTTGSGNATVTLDAGHTQVSVALAVHGLTGPPTLAHIHKAARGVNGPVVVDFNAPVNFLNGRLNATFNITKALGDDIAEHPDQFYVNVHTTANPTGEIRGQLSLASDVVRYAGELRGTNTVPPNSSAAVGAFYITIDPSFNLIWEINLGILQNATLAHLHSGGAGSNGDILLTFAAGPTEFQNGRSFGTVSTAQLSVETRQALLTNPAGFYVDVHSNALPNGEIRGQLAPAQEYDVAIAGRVTNALGQTFITNLRVFNPNYDKPAAALLEYFGPNPPIVGSAAASIAVNIPPRATAVFDDVNGPSGFNVPGTGGVRVSSNSKLAVTSHIFNDLRPQQKGTIGQFVPAVKFENAMRRGVLTQLSNRDITQSVTGFRTNVGFFNPNNQQVTVRLELRDDNGVLLGQSVVNLTSYQQVQSSVQQLFPSADLANKPNLSVSFDASAPVVGYASVVDNISSDQFFVSAQEDVGLNVP
ncbi:MAG: CHRD domain-containing protein [Acidobacteria bacterium]|nr:CHRD domain-containing protein [Acidobacteriota bacterium]